MQNITKALQEIVEDSDRDAALLAEAVETLLSSQHLLEMLEREGQVEIDGFTFECGSLH